MHPSEVDLETLMISNADLRQVLTMSDVLDALRLGYADLRQQRAAYVPRIDLFAPNGSPDGAYQWGSMAGLTRSAGVLAVRMKSDLVSWPAGRTQEKHCYRPGLYCGLILLFDLATGVPVAIMQDGYLQHLRVGASAAIGTDRLARPDATTLALLGSGGMAWSYLEGLALVRALEHVKVYSPTREHRESFVATTRDELGLTVTACGDAEQAVRGADIIASATDSMGPTFLSEWLAPGSHVVNVTRRELSEGLLARADCTIQLGIETIPRDLDIPMMQWLAGGMAGYVAGSAREVAHLPRGAAAERQVFPTLADLESGRATGRTTASQVTLFINSGTQGLQFASAGARALELCQAAGLGHALPTSWFLQDIRD